MRWTAHEPGQDFHCVYGVNRARSWNEFLDSLSYQVAPTLNYLFADERGNIGYSLAGRIPLRREIPSLLPLNGWSESNDWKGYIPFSTSCRAFTIRLTA
jgi:penicillin amidase